jgi:hypothetical protein
MLILSQEFSNKERNTLAQYGIDQGWMVFKSFGNKFSAKMDDHEKGDEIGYGYTKLDAGVDLLRKMDEVDLVK